MRTNEERAGLIHKRTAEIKRERQKRKQRTLDMICIAACLLLIIGIGSFMPGLAAGIPVGEVHHASGAASLVGSHAALGYILMGIMAFLLGVCVTVLLYRLHRRNERKHRENSDDEL
ncbi:MAG: MgtC/SapB family protein [Oscillospiraceae bacterium]|nr:MgtC/SapB family protein [Oscillospiraceae bacterium]